MTNDVTSDSSGHSIWPTPRPEDAAADNLDALLELTRHTESDVRADAAQGVEMVAATPTREDLLVCRHRATVDRFIRIIVVNCQSSPSLFPAMTGNSLQ